MYSYNIWAHHPKINSNIVLYANINLEIAHYVQNFHKI